MWTYNLIRVTKFGKLIIRGMGYSDRKAVIMSMPSHAVHLLSNIVAGMVSQMVPNSRCAMMITANVIVLIGSALVESMFQSWIMETLDKWYANHLLRHPIGMPTSKAIGPLYSMCSTSNSTLMGSWHWILFLVIYVNTVPYIMCMSLISSNIGGFTKKATTGVSPNWRVPRSDFTMEL